MGGMVPVAAVGGTIDPGAVASLAQSAATAPGSGFSGLLAAGLAQVDARVAKADALVAAFAQGEAIPVHEVTLALEQARLSVALATEVRSRLLETYRDFMAMQL